jgi:hypothetical protein
MLCVIKCLNEHIHYFNEMGFKCNKTYKYHSEFIMSAPFSFTVLTLIRLNIPLSVKYFDVQSTMLILYTKNNVLDMTKDVLSPKPINWKLQFQRHQVNKLLKITG